MHYHLKSLSLATATLLLSLTSPLLPLTLKFEPLVVQAQTIEQQEPGAEKWFLEAYQLWLKGDYPATLEELQSFGVLSQVEVNIPNVVEGSPFPHLVAHFFTND